MQGGGRQQSAFVGLPSSSTQSNTEVALKNPEVGCGGENKIIIATQAVTDAASNRNDEPHAPSSDASLQESSHLGGVGYDDDDDDGGDDDDGDDDEPTKKRETGMAISGFGCHQPVIPNPKCGPPRIRIRDLCPRCSSSARLADELVYCGADLYNIYRSPSLSCRLTHLIPMAEVPHLFPAYREARGWCLQNRRSNCQKSATGADLFALVSQSLGLREREYFGLWYLRGAPIGRTAGVPTVRRKSVTLATLPASSRGQSLRSTTAGPRSCDGGGSFTLNRSSTEGFRGSLLRHFSLQGTAASASDAIFHTGLPFWVSMEKKLVHQCKKTEMHFFFGVRIYPPDPCRDLRDEFSRFLLCLQLRRDLVSGRLACSFYTHALLSSYWVQSELGDAELYRPFSSSTAATVSVAYLSRLPLAAPLPSFDPNAWSHTGLDWTRLAPPRSERAWIRSTAGPPYPPPSVHLTPQFLRLVALFHRQLRGLVASRADFLFLQTARKLASYGIELHRVQAAPDSCPSLRKLQPSSVLQADAVDYSSPESSSAGTFSRSGFGRRSLQQRSSQTASPSSSASSSAFQRSLSLAFRTSSTASSMQGPASISPIVCDNPSPFPLLLGVFHGGLYVFSGRLRIECFPWASILKMAYRRSLRGPVRTTCESFPFPTDTRLIRLHLDGVRTFSGSASRSGTLPLNFPPPSSSPCLAQSRPFSEPDIRADAEVAAASPRRQGFRFKSGFFRRLFRMLNISSRNELRSGHLDTVPLFGANTREPFIASSSTPLRIRSLSSGASGTEADTGNALGDLSLATASGITGPSSQMSSCSLVASKASHLPFFYPEWNRPPLPGPLWRLSPTDISPGLTVDTETGCAVERDWCYFSRPSVDASSASWRGCRATWGVKTTDVPARAADTCPSGCDNQVGVMRKRLFFEVELLGDGPVRVGWSTEFMGSEPGVVPSTYTDPTSGRLGEGRERAIATAHNANLVLGSDAFGLAYLSKLEGPVQPTDFYSSLPPGSPPPNLRFSVGALLLGENSEILVESASQGDVIGCHLDLDRSIAYWTRNGQPLRSVLADSQAAFLSFAHLPSGFTLYPACSIRTSSVHFNFGETPFAFGPRPLPTAQTTSSSSSSAPWLPLSSLGMVARVAGEPTKIDGLLSLSPHLATYGLTLCPNPRTIWCLDSSSATGGLLMSADRFVARALLHCGWQTCKANSSIPLTRPPSPMRSETCAVLPTKTPDVYFEVRLLEGLNVPEAGLRLGFATEPVDTASSSASPILLGTNAFSFAICADQCGPAGTFVMHSGVARPYGKALMPGDVVGCLLNNHNGLVIWTVNGERLGHVFQLVLRANPENPHCDGQGDTTPTSYNDDIIYLPSSVLGLSPAISLRNTSVEVNFGDGPSSLRFIDKHVNVIPISTYHRTAAGRLTGQPLSTLMPTSGSSLRPRHHSDLPRGAFRVSMSRFAHGLLTGLGRSAFQHLQKSASSVSAPATSGREPVERPGAHDASRLEPAVFSDADLTFLLSKIPVVPIKTWRFTTTPSSSNKMKPVTSATIPAPGFANHLRVVRTHRVNFGLLGNKFLETEIDAVGVHRSASCEARAQAVVGIFNSKKLLQHTDKSTGARNHYGSPALVSSPMGEETLARRSHVTDLSLPSSSSRDAFICSPPVMDEPLDPVVVPK
ncbi:unnamed protein product [Schistocephalus solidus]|uniref:SPRY domain-containing protein n=1 Tax=Schistocephalus solidus TaxID=70667 RepID=A0A183SSC8_SCHSO|nr:unnamed protein product [Schistocephalus solidus]